MYSRKKDNSDERRTEGSFWADCKREKEKVCVCVCNGGDGDSSIKQLRIDAHLDDMVEGFH